MSVAAGALTSLPSFAVTVIVVSPAPSPTFAGLTDRVTGRSSSSISIDVPATSMSSRWPARCDAVPSIERLCVIDCSERESSIGVSVNVPLALRVLLGILIVKSATAW